jgi:putative membrane-bound dehydrogenase-like protein
MTHGGAARRAAVLPLALLGLGIALADSIASEPLKITPVPPRSPKEEMATFRLPAGFHAELVAAEPNVIDPVAFAFDQDGKLYVAEMPGYPNGGLGTGEIHSGRIKLLEDRDGDGFFEHGTTFADGLRFPMSIQPWKGGILVAVAPEILYLEATRGDGRADKVRRLYTGFGLKNIQQMLNGLQWGLDNWVYGCAGLNPSEVHSLEKPDMPLVDLRGRGVRFQPEVPGRLEPVSCGGQYGLAADDWERWFTNTNNQHLRHIILPDHYLRRNPSLPVAEVTLDIPDHGAACKVYRISPFEGWRVERTRRRRESPDSKRYPDTELVPGGYITSGCSPAVATTDLFPEAYRGNTFICDPANNLVHRDILLPEGATFRAKRAEPDHEFLASTDNWFRPVYLAFGPDGALYIADFYREVIETPLSLPEDIKKAVNLQSRGRGRIWRIVPDSFRPGKKPALGHATAAELVVHLADGNAWWRLTAQRLLIEKQDRSVVGALRKLARTSPAPLGRAHALWTLDGLRAMDAGLIEAALADGDAGVREQALRLAESHVAANISLRAAVVALADDSSARVRFQLAFTLGEVHTPQAIEALAKLALRDARDPWTQVAILSSTSRSAPQLLKLLVRGPEFTAGASECQLQMLTRLAALVAARGHETELSAALELLGDPGSEAKPWQLAIVDGLGQGLQNTPRSFAQLWHEPAGSLQKSLSRLRPIFTQAAKEASEGTRGISARLAAVRLVGFGPSLLALKTLEPLLSPSNSAMIQLAAVKALSLQSDPTVAGLLLGGWDSYSPSVRREVLEAIFARPERLGSLVRAMKENKVLVGQLEPFRLQQLQKVSDVKLREEALALVARRSTTDRQKTVQAYRPALDLTGDAVRGKAVFKKNCATCHRLEDVGVEVGPDLLSALRTKTRETLLVDLLDPSREVDPRYINYVVTTKSGRFLTGMIATDTSSSITLRRAEKAEDTVLRSEISEIQATAKSLMPENLELQLTKQDVADVIAYLLAVAGH